MRVLSALARGSRDAANEFHTRLFGGVQRAARRWLRDCSRPAWTSEDVTQLAFMQFFAMDSLSTRFAHSGAAVRCLKEIAKCRAVDINRHESRGHRFEHDLSLEVVSEPISHRTPEAIASDNDILNYFASLRPWAPAAIEMLLEGHQQTVVAQQVGKSDRAIRRWLSDGREQCKQQ